MRNVMMVIIGLFMITMFVVHTVVRLNTSEWVDIKVTDKERIVERSGDGVKSKYLIFTDTETFENTDEFFLGKFNSSDFYGKLKENHTYHVKVIGWRIGYFSSYRNIVEIGYEVQPTKIPKY